MESSKISSKYLSLLFVSFMSFNPNGITSQVQAMDRADSPKTSFGDFKSTETYRNMRGEQRSALEGTWNSYGNIDSKNMDNFFSQLDVLAQKTTDGKGVPRNGKILGQQAGDIKKYVRQELSRAAPQQSAPAKQPASSKQSTTPANMIMTDKEKGYYLGTNDLTKDEYAETVYKMFNILRDYTKNQFGGKGFFTANAENLMSFDELRSFMNADTGVGPNRKEGRGLCFHAWNKEGTILRGTLLIPGILIQMGGDKIPEGFFTPAAKEFLKNTPRAIGQYELLEGGDRPIEGCLNLLGM